MRPNQFNRPPIESAAAPTHAKAISESPTPGDAILTLKVLPRDLLPGDVVTPAWAEDRISAFDTALVERVSDESITLFRPYAATPAFVHGREPGVIPLIGVERYDIPRSSTIHVFRRWHSTVA